MIPTATLSEKLTSNFRNKTLWISLIEHVTQNYLELLRYSHEGERSFVSHGNVSSTDANSHLKKLSLVAPTVFDQCEALLMMGKQQFRDQKYKTSLSLFRTVFDKDPTHLEVLPIMTWNCLMLGLTSDATLCEKNHRMFHEKTLRPEAYRTISESTLRFSTLVYLCQSLLSGRCEDVSRFQEKWVSLGLETAEFAFNVIFTLNALMQSDVKSASVRIRSLYHAHPQEWLPSMMWAIHAYGERDLAVCDEMAISAAQKAPQLKSVIQGLHHAMIAEYVG